MSRRQLGRLFQYVAVGGVGTAAHYLTLAGLHEGAGLDVVPATFAGSLVGALVNYLLNRRFVFASDHAHRVALPRFLAIAAIAVVLNAALMKLWLAMTPLPWLVAQVLTTGLLLIVTYAGNAIWTFRR